MNQADLRSRLTMDKSQFDRTARAAEGRVGQMSSRFRDNFKAMAASFAGVFAVQGITTRINGITKELDRIGKLSTQLNISAEAMQRIKFVAEQGGADMEIFARALTKISAALGDPKNKAAANAIEGLNINLETFKRTSAEEKLAMLAEGFKNSEDKGQALAHLVKLVGDRVAKEMVPALKDGGDAVRELGDSIITMSEESVRSAEKFNDAINKMKTNLKAFVVESPKVARESGFLSGLGLGPSPDAVRNVINNAKISQMKDRVESGEASKTAEENRLKAIAKKEQEQEALKALAPTLQSALGGFMSRVEGGFRRGMEEDILEKASRLTKENEMARGGLNIVKEGAMKIFKSVAGFDVKQALGLRPANIGGSGPNPSGLSRLEEAFLAIQQGGESGGKKSPSEETAKNTKTLVDRFEKMNREMEEMKKQNQFLNAKLAVAVSG